VPGNTAPVSEFNFVADPFAAEELFSPSNPLLPTDRLQLLPLDITELHRLEFEAYKARVDPDFGSGKTDGKEPLIAFTSAFLERTREIMGKFGMDWFQLHGAPPSSASRRNGLTSMQDPLVIFAALSNPPSLPLHSSWRIQRRPFQIETCVCSALVEF
jgi:hypothetical protein